MGRRGQVSLDSIAHQGGVDSTRRLQFTSIGPGAPMRRRTLTRLSVKNGPAGADEIRVGGTGVARVKRSRPPHDKIPVLALAQHLVGVDRVPVAAEIVKVDGPEIKKAESEEVTAV